MLQDTIPKLVSRRNVLHFRKNEVIFSQGDAADAIFYIQAGRVKVAVVSPSGKEATLSMFAAKDLVGLGCLSLEKQRLGTATALERSESIRIEAIAGSSSFGNSRSCSKLNWPIYRTETSNFRRTCALRFLSAEPRSGRNASSNLTRHTGFHGRDYPLPNHLFHEPLQTAGPHRLQRQRHGSSFAARCSPAGRVELQHPKAWVH